MTQSRESIQINNGHVIIEETKKVVFLMRKIVGILSLISFSIFGFGCSQKKIEHHSTELNTESIAIESSESAIKVEEHLKISHDNELKFIIENVSDKTICVHDSEIEVFEFIDDKWKAIDFLSFLEVSRDYIEPSTSIDYIVPEQLKNDVDYKLTIPYALNPYDNGTLEQTYYFNIHKKQNP